MFGKYEICLEKPNGGMLERKISFKEERNGARMDKIVKK